MDKDPANHKAVHQNKTPDARIVQQVLAGDTQAFSLLVERHAPAVRSLVEGRGLRGLEADEVAQEAFVKVFQQLTNLRDGRRFAAFLLATTRNCVVDKLRRKQREASSQLPDALADKHPHDTSTETKLELREAISRLPHSMQVVLGMKYGGGSTAREIAETLNQPVGAVTKTLSRAYARLRRNTSLRQVWQEGDES